MPVSAGIYNALMQPVRSVADYAADYDQVDLRKQGIQRNALMLQQSQAEMADRERARKEGETLRNALSSLGAGATHEQRIGAMEGTGLPQGFTQADALRKTLIEQQKAAAQAAKDQAEAKAKEYALTRQKLEHGVQWLQVAQNPQQAAQMFADGVRKGYWGMQDAQQQAQGIPQDPAQFQMWKRTQLAQILDAAKLLPVQVSEDQGATRMFGTRDPLTGALTQNASVPITQSANSAATVAATIRGQNLTDARARDNNEIQRAAQRTQIVDTPNGPMLVDKGTAQGRPVIAGDGKPVPGENAMKREAGAKRVLSLLDQAEKLIPDATGSYAGAAADTAARVVGAAPGGAQAIAKLKALEGSLLAEMPRMEGPQSNADVQMYKQAAGELGDPTAPRANKLAALETIREIQSRYAGAQVPAKPREGGATGSFDDPEKERRYQEWKRKQGQ